MSLLIDHGTWIIVPIGLFVAFVYLHVYPKVYGRLLARWLQENDCLESARTEPDASPSASRARRAPGSRALRRLRRPTEISPFPRYLFSPGTAARIHLAEHQRGQIVQT